MENDGGAETSAPTPVDAEQQKNISVVGSTVPSITSTISGLPISPVYAGQGVIGKPFKALRQAHFTRSVANAKPEVEQVNYDRSFVPQRRGTQAVVNMERELIGDGEQHVDPLDNFKPQSFREGQTTTDDTPEQVDKEYRNVGRKAYKSENKGNSERPKTHQVRYS